MATSQSAEACRGPTQCDLGALLGRWRQVPIVPLATRSLLAHTPRFMMSVAGVAFANTRG